MFTFVLMVWLDKQSYSLQHHPINKHFLCLSILRYWGAQIIQFKSVTITRLGQMWFTVFTKNNCVCLNALCFLVWKQCHGNWTFDPFVISSPEDNWVKNNIACVVFENIKVRIGIIFQANSLLDGGGDLASFTFSVINVLTKLNFIVVQYIYWVSC